MHIIRERVLQALHELNKPSSAAEVAEHIVGSRQEENYLQTEYIEIRTRTLEKMGYAKSAKILASCRDDCIKRRQPIKFYTTTKRGRAFLAHLAANGFFERGTKNFEPKEE